MIATERNIAAVMAENKRLHRTMSDQDRAIQFAYAALLTNSVEAAREILEPIVERSTPATINLQPDVPRLIGKMREREQLLLETLSWLNTPGNWNSKQAVVSRLRARLKSMGVIGG